MIEIEDVVSSYFREGSPVGKENGFLIIHGLYYRKAEAFGDRRKEECRTVLYVPVFYRIRNRAYDGNPVLHAEIGCLFHDFLFVGRLVSGNDKFVVIVFQQEIRRFLLYIGNKYFYRIGNRFGRNNGFRGDRGGWISELAAACGQMAKSRTGALIIIARKNDLLFIQETGDTLKAEISQRLIETVFFKNTPLHDGAMIIQNGRIEAARCVLPSTERLDISPALGMRHRAAIGITEQTDAIAVVVSEQTGRISMAESGLLQMDLTVTALKEKLMKMV